ncbi:MAG TPA: hypothetical protein DCP28_05120, partial [Cytophagales bacterium]|nr:hypothetical protein [Cytophagales bacterium]
GMGVEETDYAGVLAREIEEVSDTDRAQQQRYRTDVAHVDSLLAQLPGLTAHVYPIRWRLLAETDDVFEEDLPDLRRMALNQMEASDQANLVTSLKQQDKLALLTWYQTHRKQYITYLNALTQRLVQFTYALQRSDSTGYGVLVKTYEPTWPLRPAVTPVPPHSQQGDYLGVFEQAMGWLLEIESYALVMIIGMVGFGLLGAASGSFIRDSDRRRTQGGPFVEDLPGVLIKGFTASMVIFLGIQGSLAVLGNGGEPPDSNLLFFMALVGAVFSDRAWDWARQKFEETLNKEPSEDDPESIASAPVSGGFTPRAFQPHNTTATQEKAAEPPPNFLA